MSLSIDAFAGLYNLQQNLCKIYWIADFIKKLHDSSFAKISLLNAGVGVVKIYLCQASKDKY